MSNTENKLEKGNGSDASTCYVKTLIKMETLLKQRDYPNCTQYLIWHYTKEKQIDLAYSVLRRDGHKLGKGRDTVTSMLNELNEIWKGIYT